MRHPGILYDLQDGRLGIAYHDNQLKEFKQFNKVLLHLIDINTLEIILNGAGKPLKILKLKTKLKPIGFVD